MLINVSENVIKPLYGDDYFGVKLLERLREASVDKVVISDGGFDPEIAPLRLEYGANLKVVRLVCDWAQYDESDSRGYVADYDVEVRLFRGMIEQGVRDIMLAVSE